MITHTPTVRQTGGTPPVCSGCGERAWVKDRTIVELADLTCFWRPVTLRWRKHRFCCPRSWCRVGSWTHEDSRIAAPLLSVTDRVGRWATVQVGRASRAVSDVAGELGACWHAINDAVIDVPRGASSTRSIPDQLLGVTLPDTALFVVHHSSTQQHGSVPWGHGPEDRRQRIPAPTPRRRSAAGGDSEHPEPVPAQDADGKPLSQAGVVPRPGERCRGEANDLSGRTTRGYRDDRRGRQR
jgi:hypothetical protein